MPKIEELVEASHGKIGADQETREQTASRHRVADLALLGLAISKSAQPAGGDVVVKLPAAQFAAAVEAWFESQ
jgi:hypothetical protein